MNIPDDFYAYIKAQLQELDRCLPDSGIAAQYTADILQKCQAVEQGQAWAQAGQSGFETAGV